MIEQHVFSVWGKQKEVCVAPFNTSTLPKINQSVSCLSKSQHVSGHMTSSEIITVEQHLRNKQDTKQAADVVIIFMNDE